MGRRDAVWWAGLAVAAAAAAATAHGLYAVAAASDVPWPVAALYPVMTDGLALVAYSATNRLTDGWPQLRLGRSSSLAAGLSGAAQALYLAGGGGRRRLPAVRFGIGAAPAVAAAGGRAPSAPDPYGERPAPGLYGRTPYRARRYPGPGRRLDDRR